jgi:hypothetical protein
MGLGWEIAIGCGVLGTEWLVLGVWTFRAKRRREYHRANPRRDAADRAYWLVQPVWWGSFLAVMNQPHWTGTRDVWNWWVVGLAAGGFLVAGIVSGLLQWRAHRAGEPTWYQWKHRPGYSAA